MDKKMIAEVDVRDPEQVARAAEVILKKMKDEKKTFHEVAGLSDAFLERLYAIAYSYYNQGKFPQALHYFHLLTAMNAKNQKYYFGLGATFQQLEQYEYAASAFMMTLCLDPSHPLPAYYAANCYLKDNQKDAAGEALGIAIELCGAIPEHAQLKERCLLTKQNISK